MPLSALSCPRVLVAGLSGGSGKTIVSLGLARAFTDQGLLVQPFKKGPDYIDAQWLSLASRRVTTNLDPFLCSSQVLQNLFWQRAAGADIALLEGNRGLYDGKDMLGTYSSAELAKALRCPVLVVADCTKVTRTMAAMVQGLVAFDPGVDIRGVILNRVAGGRHRKILRQTIEHYADVPVLGVLPKIPTNPIPERHMGLMSEAELGSDPFTVLASFVRENIDLDACLRVATAAPEYVADVHPVFSKAPLSPRVRLGVARDAALWFYYQENLDALAHAGAELVEFSLLEDASLPDVHGLYLGGGFPETLAQGLALNRGMRAAVLAQVEAGLPVYAECGGLMYLSREVIFEGATYPMADVFPVTAKVFPRPQGHGYMTSVVATSNPFYLRESVLSGHEFHYSRCLGLERCPEFVFRIERGQGMTSGWDGVLRRNCLAGYMHTHALGNPDWACNFVHAAERYKAARAAGAACEDIRLG